MYYIVNLFEIIYEINDNNHIEGYSEEFEYYLVLEKLQESLNYAMKKTGYKNKIIDVEEIMEKDESQSHNNMLGFANWIINKY